MQVITTTCSSHPPHPAVFFYCCLYFEHQLLYHFNSNYLLSSQGSSDYYLLRVYYDWKKHVKQTIQRLMALPFICCPDHWWCYYCKVNLKKNHTIQEHLIRLSSLRSELDSIYLNDLYKEKRFTSSSTYFSSNTITGRKTTTKYTRMNSPLSASATAIATAHTIVTNHQPPEKDEDKNNIELRSLVIV